MSRRATVGASSGSYRTGSCTGAAMMGFADGFIIYILPITTTGPRKLYLAQMHLSSALTVAITCTSQPGDMKTQAGNSLLRRVARIPAPVSRRNHPRNTALTAHVVLLHLLHATSLQPSTISLASAICIWGSSASSSPSPDHTPLYVVDCDQPRFLRFLPV